MMFSVKITNKILQMLYLYLSN